MASPTARPGWPTGNKERCAAYRLHPVELRRDDRLLLLTDGIFEAHHVGRPFFGLDRVARMLTTHSHLPPVKFIRHLTQAVIKFRSGKLADDVTAVCLDCIPAPDARPTRLTSRDLAPMPMLIRK
ncbi:MAG: serine/threonine-protein phosphatase [Actinomycetota bacterium]|nr:serine/threonine-protein phosphatase [Actinomycetota bacterium]